MSNHESTPLIEIDSLNTKYSLCSMKSFREHQQNLRRQKSVH